jgi:hypothetical protein
MSWESLLLGPTGKWPPLYAPNDPWTVNPPPPIPDPPYPNFWKYGQADGIDQGWSAKAFGAFPPMKTMMAEDYSDHFPPFGVLKVFTPYNASKYSVKVRMWGQFNGYTVTPYDKWRKAKFQELVRTFNGGRPYMVRTRNSSFTVKPKPSLNWSQHQNEPKARQYRVARPRTPSGDPDLFA